MIEIIIKEDGKKVMHYRDVTRYYLLGQESKDDSMDFISMNGDYGYLVNSLSAHGKRLLTEATEKMTEIKVDA